MEKLGAVEAYRGSLTETRQTAALQVVVEVEVTGHPRLNGRHGQKLQGLGSVCAWSMRQGVAQGRRNWLGTVVGAVAVRGEIVAA